MGVRHFKPREEKDSRIKWEKADALTAKKLAIALKKEQNPIGLFIFAAMGLFGFCFLWVLIGALVLMFMRGEGHVFYAFILGYAIFLVGFMIFRGAEYRPYLNPAKQKDVWIFYATCQDAPNYGMRRPSDMATFNKGGRHIAITIPHDEFLQKPAGKTYVFLSSTTGRGTAGRRLQRKSWMRFI